MWQPFPPVSAHGHDGQTAPNGLIADPSMPIVGEFIRHEVLRGTIRTVPAGRGRVLIVPSAGWSHREPTLTA